MASASADAAFSIAAFLFPHGGKNPENHKEEDEEDYQSACTADGISGGDAADEADQKGANVSETALVADGEPGPLCAVHLTPDGTDRRKARCTKEVEHQEGETGDGRERF